MGKRPGLWSDVVRHHMALPYQAIFVDDQPIQPYWATVWTGVLLLASLALERSIQTSVSERLVATANLSAHQKGAQA